MPKKQRMPVRASLVSCMAVLLGFLSTDLSVAQTRLITGTVTEASTGMPLAGVSVQVRDGAFEVSTDAAGAYSLEAATGDVLVFSLAGFATQYVTVGRGSVTNVTLAGDIEPLEQLVVVGYGSQQRTGITASVQRVLAEDAGAGLVGSPEQLYQGRVAGVNVIQSGGEPGAPATVRFRGGTSIIASNEPLYVIDGIPIDNGSSAPVGADGTDSGRKNPLVFLNPHDIETIDVLRDASAAAVYGNRGANGVVLVSTKGGADGQLQVDYDGSVSASSFVRALPVLSAAEYRQFVNSNGLPTLRLGEANTNWQDAITRTAVSQDHNLAFGGGTPETQYRASASYRNQQGIIINSGMERVTGRVNVRHEALEDRLGLDLRMTGSFFQDNRAPFQQTGGYAGGLLANVLKFNPTLPVYNADGSFYEISGQTSVRNPVALAEQVQDLTSSTRLLSSFKADYSVVPGLTASMRLGLDRQQASRRVFIPGANPLRRRQMGEARQGNNEFSSVLAEAYGSYVRSSAKSHRIGLVGGYSFQEFFREGFHAATTGLASDRFSYTYLGAGDSETYSIGSFKETSRIVSFFGRLSYDYLNRYMVTASVRRDGSSRFGPDNEWGIFPAVTVGWRVSDLAFIQRRTRVSDLKLRVGWGITGNHDFGTLGSPRNLRATDISLPADTTVQGAIPVFPDHPALKWEETSQVNFGIDYGFWSDRLYGSVDYYLKNTHDLLLELEVPEPTAVPTRLANAGRMQNRGVDAVANARVLDRGRLFLELGAVFSANRNTVKDLGGLTRIYTGRASGAGLSLTNTQIITPGHSFGSFLAPVFAGFDGSSGEQRCRSASGANVACYEVPRSEWEVVGSALPDFEYGLTADFTYGNWDLSLFLRGEHGRHVFNNTGLEFAAKNLVHTQLNFLRTALDDPTPLTDTPQYSSRWIQEASFLRVEVLSLGYTFAGISALNRLAGTVRRARIYVAANNLFVFTDYAGWDPEVNTEASARLGRLSILSHGIDYTNYPRPRTVTAGISLGF